MKKWTWTLILAGAVVLLFFWSIREQFTSYEDALKDVGQTAGYTDLTKPKKAETTSKADAAKAAEEEASAALKAFQALGPINSQAESVERDKELQRINGLQEKARKLSSEADDERASQMGREGAPISEATMRARCSNEISTKEWDKVSADCKAFMSNTPSDSSARPTGGTVGSAGGSGLPQGFRKGNIWGPAYTGLGDNSGDGLNPESTLRSIQDTIHASKHPLWHHLLGASMQSCPWQLWIPGSRRQGTAGRGAGFAGPALPRGEAPALPTHSSATIRPPNSLVYPVEV